MDRSIAPELLTRWRRHADDVLKVSEQFHGCQFRAPNTPHEIEVAKILMFKLVQATRTYRAILALVDIGDGANALVLSRVLFEHVVDSIYLLKNPNDVWRYFANVAKAQKDLKNARKYAPIESMKSVNRVFDELYSYFNQRANAESQVTEWPSVHARAKQAGCKKLYDLTYPVTSPYVHGGSSALFAYLEAIKIRQGVSFGYDTPDGELDDAIIFPTIQFLEFVEVLTEAFAFDSMLPDVERLRSQQRAISRDSFDSLDRRFHWIPESEREQQDES